MTIHLCQMYLKIDIWLGLIGQQVYKGWRKERYYISAIDKTATVEEVEAVVWEDKYKG